MSVPETELNLACQCRDTVDNVRYEISLAIACWSERGSRKNAPAHEEHAQKFIMQARELLDRIEQGLRNP